MDVGDVHLVDWTLKYLHGVVDRDRGEGVGGRIDDKGVGRGAGGLDQVDQFALVVRLVKRKLRAGKGGELLAGGLDGVERGRSVDVRLADAEHVQIRTIEDHDTHGIPFAGGYRASVA